MMTPRYPVLVIAHATFLEALRNRLIWLNAAFLLAAFLGAEFVAQVAITEADAFQAGLLGAGLRLYAVLMLSVFVVTSLVREFNDKGHELLLSRAIPRWVYLMGKWVGYAGVGALVAAVSTLVVLLYAPWPGALAWGVSLCCELGIIAALCLLCLLSFTHVTAALCVVGAFYLTARSIPTLLLMSTGPFTQSGSVFDGFSEHFLMLLAYLLPDLASFAASEWLVYGEVGWSEMRLVFGQTFIYITLLLSAGAFDLYRKNL